MHRNCDKLRWLVKIYSSCYT